VLQVMTTSTATAATWGAMPVGSKTYAALFADPTNLLVRAVPSGATTGTLYKTTAAVAATPIATNVARFELPRNSSSPTGTARYAFVNTNTTATSLVGDLAAYDLTATTPTAIPVATSTLITLIAVSYDQVYARVLESYDATSLTGTLTMVALPGGTKTTLTAGVPQASVAFVNTHSVAYFDPTSTPGTLTEWTDGASTTYANHVYNYRVRYTPSTLYFTLENADTLFNYFPGVWSVPLR
jgi:hypothetical protein